MVRGLIYIMSGGRTIENFGGAISSYGNKTVFAGITLYYAIAVVLVAISHLALTKTRKGQSTSLRSAITRAARIWSVFPC